MTIEKIGRTGSPPFLQLVECLGSFENLGAVKTGNDYKKEMIAIIKQDLANWMMNEDFDSIKAESIDLAIVAKVSPYRMGNQDTDNIAKVICDALKQQKGDPRFLFDDDCQIVRALVWKIQRAEYEGYDTDSYSISFRKHDSNKPMELLQPEII